MDVSITTGLAVLGAALGVFNALRSWRNDKVRLRVKPIWVIREDQWIHAVSITNLSTFSVTLERLDFSVDGKGRLYLLTRDFFGGDILPKKMEPRTCLTALFPVWASDEVAAQISKVCATTQCGTTFTGTGPVLKQWISQAKTSLAAKKAKA